MSCLHSNSYLVLLNGQPVGNIKPSRGLHQGDPLSPYLFLSCALGLQSLIQKVEVDEDIRGVFLWRNGPQVSHLFFTDDSVLFSRAMEANATKFWRSWLSIREVQGKKIIGTRLISFLVLILRHIFRPGSKHFWGFLPYINMRNIWACQHL